MDGDDCKKRQVGNRRHKGVVKVQCDSLAASTAVVGGVQGAALGRDDIGASARIMHDTTLGRWINADQTWAWPYWIDFEKTADNE